MTMQQHPLSVRDTLEEMGYTAADVERVINAGHGTSILQAVEYLSENPNPTPPDKTAVEYPQLASSQNATSVNSSLNPPTQRGITNARDSLDGIHGKRMSGVNATSAQTTDNSHLNEQDELQKVIELSKQEHQKKIDEDTAKAMQASKKEGHISAERQDEKNLQKAIQQSLMENQHANEEHAGSWQSHGFVSVKDRARMSIDEPVGLKNIGNTCYLNSLLQVYFHLPDFRRAVMKFRGPEEAMITIAEDNRSLRDQSHVLQPNVTIPDDVVIENETPEDRAERKLYVPQLDQSFGPPGQMDQVMRPADDTSGMSGNHLEESEENTVARHAMRFVVELQKLFAAMALGNQNCVDPTGVVRAMRDAEGKPIVVGTQEDASEFNHLFLDNVERGLRAASNGSKAKESESTSDRMLPEGNSASVRMDESSDSKDSENIIKDMFTAQFRQEVRRTRCESQLSDHTNEVQDTSSFETNAIIVDATARKYRDIHSGLEDYAFASIDDKSSRNVDGISGSLDGAASCAQGNDINEAHAPNLAPGDDFRRAESNCPALKSVWFTKMPPFLVIYLQRVRFNRTTRRAEKVHDKYEFSTQLAFDRYMLENRDASAKARGVVQRIRRDRDSVQGLLERYEMFPNREPEKQVKPQDYGAGICTSELREGQQTGASTNTTKTTGLSDVIELDKSGDTNESFFVAAARVRTRLQEALQSPSSHFAVDGISQESLSASIDTLTAVIQQDQERHRSLKRKLETLHKEEENAYEGLDKHVYHLHAVLVHDGAPSSGHYWTFIRNWKSSNAEMKWMKLSDSSVTYVSEKEMLHWSSGGSNSASAYCLIYGIESALRSSIDGAESIAEESRRLLPQCRLDEVDEDSARFQRELNEQVMT